MRGAPAALKTKVAAAPRVQKSLAESFAKGIPYDKKSRWWREITEAITRHICKDMVPIYTVEKPGFRELLSTLDPRYVMPSRKHFTEVELPWRYGECRTIYTVTMIWNYSYRDIRFCSYRPTIAHIHHVSLATSSYANSADIAEPYKSSIFAHYILAFFPQGCINYRIYRKKSISCNQLCAFNITTVQNFLCALHEVLIISPVALRP